MLVGDRAIESAVWTVVSLVVYGRAEARFWKWSSESQSLLPWDARFSPRPGLLRLLFQDGRKQSVCP